MNLPEAYIFETGSNKWTTYDAWPPKNPNAKNILFPAQRKTKHTARQRKNLPEQATQPNGYDTYFSDPAKPVPYTEDVHLGRTREYMSDDQRFAARRPDVLVYQTDVLNAPLTVTGACNRRFMDKSEHHRCRFCG